ncbi:MAG TPA: PAS domain S-box protein [Nitrospiraceae bacterium]|jgi:PAS domain S-box-containing protein|nr:PAS domain S-box protein [Nitrospiraceae bacterium]
MDRIADDKITEFRPLSLAHVPFPNITPGTLFLLQVTIGLLLAGIFAWDLVTPLGQVPWLLYAPVLLFTLLMPYRWDALVLAGICTALIVADFFFSPPSVEPVEPWIAIFNRSVGLVMIWVTAVGCLLYKHSQQALAKVQDRLAYLVRNNPAVVYARKAGRDWVFSSISENAKDVLGYDMSEFLQDATLWANCIHPEDRAKISGDWAKSFSDQIHHSFEYRFRHKDGAYRWLRDEVRLVRQPVEDGITQPIYIGFCSDITERKRAEAALRNSESRLRAILDNSPNLIFVKDLQGRYVMVNREFEWALSISHEQIIGKTDAEIFPAAQAAAFEANDRKVLHAGHALEFEEEALHKDGPHTSIVYKFPLYDHQGSPYAIGGIATDITERKRVAAALHASQSDLAEAQRVAKIGSWRLDLINNRVTCSDELYRIFGLGKSDFAGTHESFLSRVHLADRQLILETNQKARTEGKPFDIVFRILLPTEELKMIRGVGHASRDAAAHVVRLFGTVQDITEHMRAEDALRESESRLRAIVNSEPECVKLVSLNGTLFEMNPAGLAMIEAESADQVIGKNVLQLIYPDDRSVYWKLHELAGSGTAGTLQFRILGLRGTMRWMETHAGPLRDADGRITSVLSVTRDITERKQVEDQLRQSRRQLQALTAHLQSVREQERARIARELHDEFGQVLTGLKIDLSWLGGVLRRLGRSKTVKPLLDRTYVMTNLVDESIATIRKLVAELRPAILDHLDLVAALEWQARDFQKRTGIDCEFRCTLTGIDLAPDRKTAVFRIVQEALTNVARHAKATHVTISMEEAGGQLELVVEDDGRGIADHEMASPSAFGILGMQERVELLRGQLSVHGRPGVGTTVGVVFPTKTEA